MEETLQMLMEDNKLGKCRSFRYQQVVQELALVDGLAVRGKQLIIPQALRGDVIQLAH